MDAKNNPKEIKMNNGISGMTRAKATTFLRKLLIEGTTGIKRDNGWSAVNDIFARLSDAGIAVETSHSEYYKIPNSSNLNDGKRWVLGIAGGWTAVITASYAGSAKDPSDAYDIIVCLHR